MGQLEPSRHPLKRAKRMPVLPNSLVQPHSSTPRGVRRPHSKVTTQLAPTGLMPSSKLPLPLHKTLRQPHPRAQGEERSAGPGPAPRRTSPALPTSARPGQPFPASATAALSLLQHGGRRRSLASLGGLEEHPLYDTRPEHSEDQPNVTPAHAHDAQRRRLE